jgi:hypothetical protein
VAEQSAALRDLHHIGGIDDYPDVLGEAGPYNGNPQTFSGIIIPAYNMPPGNNAGQTNFKVVDLGTMDEDNSSTFDIVPAAAPQSKLSLGIGIGL